MKTKKKLGFAISTLVSICLCFIVCFTFAGCNYKLPRYESGDFIYDVKKLDGGKKEAYLVGLTEQGTAKKYLVLPSKIDGITVASIGYYQPTFVFGFYVPQSSDELIKSKMERLYIQEASMKAFENTIVNVILEESPSRLIFQFIPVEYSAIARAFWNDEKCVIPHANLSYVFSNDFFNMHLG